MDNIHFISDDFNKMEKQFRTQIINSLTGFKSANLIGTINPEGITNVSIFSSAVHIGANPPLIGLIFRPVTVPRHTYQNIKATGHYTINHVHKSFFNKAHHTSARFAEGISEFAACGLTPEFSQVHPAPYVRESFIKIGLKFEEEYSIQINQTILIIGSIIETFLPKTCLSDDGFIDLDEAGTVALSGLDSYHETKRLTRLSYAKPDHIPKKLILENFAF